MGIVIVGPSPINMQSARRNIGTEELPALLCALLVKSTSVPSSLMKKSFYSVISLFRRCIITMLAAGLFSVSSFAQRPMGVDVSSYQGSSVNWATAKANGISFAYAKATEGLTVNDSTFTVNMANAKAAGVYIGAYHFAHPELHTPADEAAHFWSIAGPYIKNGGAYLHPLLDYERFTNGIVG